MTIARDWDQEQEQDRAPAARPPVLPKPQRSWDPAVARRMIGGASPSR
ncbi:hypothetical protein ABZ714_00815 [Streptomyces sp. NPDC006798]